MKRLWVLFGVLLAVAGSPKVWADGIPQIVDTTTNAKWTRTVYNNSGASIASRSVVIWDNDATGTQFDRSGYPYITTTTTADNIWTAGVTMDSGCPSSNTCEIVVSGPTLARLAKSTDSAVEDQLVGSTTVSGQVGDYVPAANSCALGSLMEDLNQDTTTACNTGFDNCPVWVFVRISCQ